MKKIFPYILIPVLIGVDQLIKWWVLKHPSFVIKNSGFIFGYGPSWDLFFWIAIFVILIFALITIKKPANTYPFALMLAGASSNLIDRIFRGGVIDYFNIGYLKFNLADLLLMAGVIIYAWQIQRENKN